VIVWFRSPNGEASEIVAGYQKMRDELVNKPGLLASELMQSVQDPSSFGVLSEWESKKHFVAWQQEPGHDNDTSPMDAYLDRSRPNGRYADMFQIVDNG
jgi:heme-degrading monooxygenase HmoA